MSRSGEIFGRETELVRLQRFVDAIPSGPHVLVIHGEAGVGKTTLWREGIRLANERSYQVLSCRPAEYEVQLPYASFGDLLESVGTQMFGVLPSPQQRALEVVLLRADTDEEPAAGIR